MQTQEVRFGFKSRIIKDAEGNVLAKTKKQSPVTVGLQYATVEDLKTILSLPAEKVVDEKTKQEVERPARAVLMVLEAVNSLVYAQARGQFDDIIEGFGADETKVVTADMLDHDKLTLEAISNLDPKARGVRVISEDDWTSFYDDYFAVMVAATGKPEKNIKNHLDIFKKPTKVKSAKDILGVLIENLDIYIGASGNIEDTAECVNRIKSKFDKWLKEEDKIDIDAL